MTKDELDEVMKGMSINMAKDMEKNMMDAMRADMADMADVTESYRGITEADIQKLKDAYTTKPAPPYNYTYKPGSSYSFTKRPPEDRVQEELERFKEQMFSEVGRFLHQMEDKLLAALKEAEEKIKDLQDQIDDLMEEL